MKGFQYIFSSKKEKLELPIIKYSILALISKVFAKIMMKNF